MSGNLIGIQSCMSGQELCNEVINEHVARLRTRATVLARDRVLETRADADFSLASTEDLIRLNAASKGLLLCLGDSWFDYYLIDVSDSLKKDFGYLPKSVASHGRSLKSIWAIPAQLIELWEKIEETKGGAAPKAILLSGGGNDLIDFGIKNLLNRFGSGLPPLKEDAVKQLVDDEIKPSLIAILDCIKSLCQSGLGKTIPILIHGYDYPIPDGNCSDQGSSQCPWLECPFLEMGYDKYAPGPQTEVMKTLIDRLNDMQLRVVAQPGYEHVKHVELRGTLAAADHTTMWGNELHPTRKGFKAIAKKFDGMLETL